MERKPSSRTGEQKAHSPPRFMTRTWRSRMGLIYLFFWPEVIHLRRRALPPPGHVAGLAKHSQNIAAENLVHVGLGITAAQQLLGEPGVRGDVLQALRPARDAVEVGADPHVVDSRDLDNVVDMIGHVLYGSSRQLGTFRPVPGFHGLLAGRGVGVFRPELLRDGLRLAGRIGNDEARAEVDHDHSAVLLDQGQDVVGNVARRRAKGVSARVAGDDRGLGNPQSVDHRRRRDMGDIDEHSETPRQTPPGQDCPNSGGWRRSRRRRPRSAGHRPGASPRSAPGTQAAFPTTICDKSRWRSARSLRHSLAIATVGVIAQTPNEALSWSSTFPRSVASKTVQPRLLNSSLTSVPAGRIAATFRLGQANSGWAQTRPFSSRST